jgi:hypothetical protein
MDGYGRLGHETVAAQLLRDKGFSEKIASLVEKHVEAV